MFSTPPTTNQIEFRRKIFEFTEGVHINYEHGGHGKRTLLLLHGFGASLETWRDIQPLLTEDFSLYLLDLKGFGLSSKPCDSRYSLHDQAEILLSFLERQGLYGITLVGHSYGGAVALVTYLTLEDRKMGGVINSLVLIDSGGYLQGLPFFVSLPGTPILNRLVLYLIPPRWQTIFTLKHLFYNKACVTDARIIRYERFLKCSGSREALIAAARQMIPKEPNTIIGRIRDIHIPTLIIWGNNDRAIPLEHGKRFHREIKDSRLVVIQECGHVPHEEVPMDTAQAIRDFFL